jgi:hypothetical protein
VKRVLVILMGDKFGLGILTQRTQRARRRERRKLRIENAEERKDNAETQRALRIRREGPATERETRESQDTRGLRLGLGAEIGIIGLMLRAAAKTTIRRRGCLSRVSWRYEESQIIWERCNASR